MAGGSSVTPFDQPSSNVVAPKAARAIVKLRNIVWILLFVCLICLAVIIALAVITGIYLQRADEYQSKSQEQFEIGWPEPSHSPLGRYVKAAIAADNGYCSEIGRDTMINGGNVIHAAIATIFCIGMMDAHSSGVGGGAFMTIYNKTSARCTVIDAREVAPIAASQTMYVNNTESATKGWLSSGVPGEVHGLWTAYQMAGNAVNWSSLIQPTINLLRNGQAVSQALGDALAARETDIRDPASNLGIFLHSDGSLYKRGDILKRPQLADSLMGLANALDPVQYFYNSSFTNNLIKDIQEGGGIITTKDMQNYRSVVRTQDQIIYAEMENGLTGCGPPPPSSAAVTMSIINIMAGYPVYNPAQNFSTLHSSTDVFQRLIETMKFSYADRSQMGDLVFVPTALPLAKHITSQSYAEDVRSKIGPTAHDAGYYGGVFSKNDGGTSHIAVIDKEGNAASITTTINTYFGSKRRSNRTGVIMNNQMDDFSTPGLTNYFGYPASPNNYIVPGKRPLSSMSPIILFDRKSKKAKMAVGGAGGSKIISSTGSVTIRALQLKESLKQAMDAPRLHNQLRPFYTQYENDFPQNLIASLSARGQDMRAITPASVVTAVIRDDDGFLYANSDFRKGDESFCSGY